MAAPPGAGGPRWTAPSHLHTSPPSHPRAEPASAGYATGAVVSTFPPARGARDALHFPTFPPSHFPTPRDAPALQPRRLVAFSQLSYRKIIKSRCIHMITLVTLITFPLTLTHRRYYRPFPKNLGHLAPNLDHLQPTPPKRLNYRTIISRSLLSSIPRPPDPGSISN
jgi:hypothetical protein